MHVNISSVVPYPRTTDLKTEGVVAGVKVVQGMHGIVPATAHVAADKADPEVFFFGALITPQYFLLLTLTVPILLSSIMLIVKL